LNLRPIFHHKENRGDAHILFSVLAYAMSVTIHLRHRQQGPNLVLPQSNLEKRFVRVSITCTEVSS
jgi:hypothetical protein